MRYLILVFIALGSIGCKEVVVRDAKVYKSELEFVDAASDETVERGKAVIASECKCETIMDVTGFSTMECNDLAETILTIEARMSYHTNFMRYLGGLSERRPPDEPPEVPDTNSLCP